MVPGALYWSKPMKWREAAILLLCPVGLLVVQARDVLRFGGNRTTADAALFVFSVGAIVYVVARFLGERARNRAARRAMHVLLARRS